MSDKPRHAGGRPTKYKQDMPQRVRDYTQAVIDGKRDEVIPTRVGLCLEFDTNRQTLINWGKAHEEFFDALACLDTTQKAVLLQRGLDGTFNSTICKLLLMSNHGYRKNQT